MGTTITTEGDMVTVKSEVEPWRASFDAWWENIRERGTASVSEIFKAGWGAHRECDSAFYQSLVENQANENDMVTVEKLRWVDYYGKEDKHPPMPGTPVLLSDGDGKYHVGIYTTEDRFICNYTGGIIPFEIKRWSYLLGE